MKRYSALVAVPETILGISYFRVEVDAEDEQQARQKAVQAAQEGKNAGFIGFNSSDGTIYWEEADVEELVPWNFQPGQKVLLRQGDPNRFPDLEVEIVQLQDDFGNRCPQCHLGRELSLPRQENGKQYLVKYPTGVIAPVQESLLELPEPKRYSKTA